MSYDAKVLTDSITLGDVRLSTLQITFPRIVLSEFNTHRKFSRSSASSRAIPVEKMLTRVIEDPFIPIYWGKNQKGMQAEQELTPVEQHDACYAWLSARDKAVYYVKELQSIGVHKQIANRMLEPFMWHTCIVTATDWANFFALRCHKDAQPEIRQVAELMRDALDASKPTLKVPGEWHLPYVTPEDIIELEQFVGDKSTALAMISSARCARVSYLTQDGKRDLRADTDLATRLQKSGHMSPFEHVAKVITADQFVGDYGNFRAPWLQYRKTLPNEAVFAPSE